ncbi:G2/M phase-specific E3 ubiquitin-protein ligase-like isoform X2 [Megalobrama amblycephala]|uniref:G2/M phase-specific E3 ubiquitin-protein ligase-like isoform X2 n=1 Tax=Megalobrama amblycephala TaxID=75352 RepID=UPI00201422E6|nr:G2/M phase-specific E3 ubiquitin-protein ligase-like isoform X2 [Megalobrama amblycephala]
MASLHEISHGVPLKVKYPSGLMRTRKFVLSDSIQALFDFVGEVEDATEWFHIQEALSPPLRNDLCGTISERNITGPTTLFVQWISSQDAESIPTPNGNDNHDKDDYNSGTVSPLDQPSTSNEHLTSFSPQSEQEKTVQKTNLQTILSRLSAKIDDDSPTSNQINAVRDYKGNTHNILRSTVQAFSRRRFNLGARLDVIFVDDTKAAEGAVDGGGPTREYLRLLLKAVQQSSIFEGPENSKRLRLDTEALHKGLYRQISQMISVCITHGGMGPHFFSERLFLQVCGKPTPPATLDEVDDETFKEMLCKIKEAETVPEAKAAIEMAEDCLSIIGAFRSISTLKQRDILVQSAVEYYADGRCSAALQQFVDGFNTLGLLQEMQTHTDLFHTIFVEDKKPLRSPDLTSLFEVNLSDQVTY